MEFTENFKESNQFRIDGQFVYLIDANGNELELFVGEEVENVRWTDEHRLLVVLKGGAIRSYENETNYIKI